jgi:hypothetical protein
MSIVLQPVAAAPVRLPPAPWRDPHTVSPARLAEHIEALELACRENPQSADLRTCLGMAYAMNFDAYKSMDALETARSLDPENFFAQLKYAELHYRLRALSFAEQETLGALDLAKNAWQAGLARKQLQEIRRLMREGTQKPAWTKSLAAPAMAVVALAALLSLCVVWL